MPSMISSLRIRLRSCSVPVAPGELVHREHRVVARVIRVVHGRPVHDLVAFAVRQVVRNRDRLAVRDQEAVERAGLRRPGAHARARARLQHVDRALRAEIVALAARRQRLLVRAPAELGRLTALADEAVDRPRVDELARTLRHVRDLRVALGDVDHLDLQLGRERRPLLARARIAGGDAGVRRKIEQRLLHEVRHQAGIRAVRQHRRRAVLVRLAQRQRFLAQRVVGAPGRRDRSDRCSRRATARCRYPGTARPSRARA